MYVCMYRCVCEERGSWPIIIGLGRTIWTGLGRRRAWGVVFLGRRREDGPEDGAHTLRSNGNVIIALSPLS
ncbi:hypothetical protein Hanom_Chr17g01569521 [Helianthus anomalus]